MLLVNIRPIIVGYYLDRRNIQINFIKAKYFQKNKIFFCDYLDLYVYLRLFAVKYKLSRVQIDVKLPMSNHGAGASCPGIAKLLIWNSLDEIGGRMPPVP